MGTKVENTARVAAQEMNGIILCDVVQGIEEGVKSILDPIASSRLGFISDPDFGMVRREGLRMSIMRHIRVSIRTINWEHRHRGRGLMRSFGSACG